MTPFAPRFLLAVLGLPLTLACGDYTSPAAVSPDSTSSTEAVHPAFRAGGRSGFGLNGSVGTSPGAEVRLRGGGSFDPATASNTLFTPTSVAAAGGFDCTTTVAQGPLAGCAAGEGVRWDTVQLLASTTFKCSGADAPRPAATDGHTALLLADFYRAGDGGEASFRAQMIVSDGDIAADIAGVQNLWVQGVGCGTANVNFN